MSWCKENKQMYQNDLPSAPLARQEALTSTIVELNDEELQEVVGGSRGTNNPRGDADDYNGYGGPGGYGNPGWYGYPNGYGYPGGYGYPYGYGYPGGYGGPDGYGYGPFGGLLPLLGI